MRTVVEQGVAVTIERHKIMVRLSSLRQRRNNWRWILLTIVIMILSISLLCRNETIGGGGGVVVTSADIVTKKKKTTLCSSDDNFGTDLLDRKQIPTTNVKVVNPHISHFPSSKGSNHHHHHHTDDKNKEEEDDDDDEKIYLCVPQKNGGRQFTALLYASWMGKPPQNIQHVTERIDSKSKNFNGWQQYNVKEQNSIVYMIARNPYSRLLSLYMQKIKGSCTSDTKLGCGGRTMGFNHNDSFVTFVKGIYNMTTMVTTTTTTTTTATTTIMTTSGGLCNINLHLCKQIDICIPTTMSSKKFILLKLEQQSEWFNCFIEKIAINETVLQYGWENFTSNRRQCYYAPTGICEQQQKGGGNGGGILITGDVHATGSSNINILREHYTSETAALVRKLYADDFRILNYSLDEYWW